MNDPRQSVLSAIARNKPADGERRSPVNAPSRLAGLSPAQSLALFEEMAGAGAATVEHAGGLRELPAAAGRYLRSHDCEPDRPVYLNSRPLAALDWAPLPVSSDKVYFDSPVCVAEAFCGIAETGSVVLLTAPGVSPAAWFLTETLIVALAGDDVLPVQEAAWARLRGGHRAMPRAATLVTGPSRTGDIEQKLVIGAHGPRRVHLVLYRR